MLFERIPICNLIYQLDVTDGMRSPRFLRVWLVEVIASVCVFSPLVLRPLNVHHTVLEMAPLWRAEERDREEREADKAKATERKT